MTKKQYCLMLGLAALLFAGCFIIAFKVVSDKIAREQIENQLPESQDSEDSTIYAQEVFVQEDVVLVPETAVCITPATQIEVRLVDANGNLVLSEQLDALALLGVTEEQLIKQFSHYTLEKFSAEEVLLVQTQQAEEEVSLPKTYFLSIEDGFIGIEAVGESVTFTSLNIPAKDFPLAVTHQLQNQKIQLTEAQKQQLQQDAYYVETLFQMYFD